MHKKEVFVVKDFVVGIIVILLIVFSLYWYLKPKINFNLFNNQFFISKEEKKEVVEENLCAPFIIFSNISPKKKFVFKRTVKRTGWSDKDYFYSIYYPKSSNKNISFEYKFESESGLNEQNEIICDKTGLKSKNLDKLLASSFLDVFPENLNEYALITSQKTNDSILSKDALDEKLDWQNDIYLQGGLNLPNKTLLSSGMSYCFELSAKAISSFKGREIIDINSTQLEAYKIERIWDATAAASLSNLRKTEECANIKEGYDNTATISFKEENWYAPSFGFVKRKISPISVSGQVSFLPNGYLPIEVTDELVGVE